MNGKESRSAESRGKDDPDGAQGSETEEVRKRTAAPGETRWTQASGDGLQRPVPQQPNELDESASSQEASSASMAPIGKAAYKDATTGVDTDRGPVLDTVYNGPVTGGHRVGDEEKVSGQRDPTKSTSSKNP